MALRSLPDPEIAPGAGGAYALGRRAADADDRPRADDEAEAAHSRRADAGLGAGDLGAAVEGSGEAAADDADHGFIRRAECDVRAAACRPRLCLGARPHRLGRAARPLRGRGRDGVFVDPTSPDACSEAECDPGSRGRCALLWVPHAASRLRECGAPHLNPNNLIAFSFRISGRTSGLMSIASKSLSQRSGEMTG